MRACHDAHIGVTPAISMDRGNGLIERKTAALAPLGRKLLLRQHGHELRILNRRGDRLFQQRATKSIELVDD